MDTVHGTADVAWTFAGEEGVKCDEGFSFAAGGIEEGGSEDVHALNVDARLRNTSGIGNYSLVSAWSHTQLALMGSLTSLRQAAKALSSRGE